MRAFTRPGIGEAIASAVCLCAIVGSLVAVDPRVHDRVEAFVVQASSQGAGSWGERGQALVSAVVQAARDRTLDQAPLLVFAAVGAALLIFMLRT